MQFLENVSLKKYNTFGVEAGARYFVTVSDKEELKSVVTGFDPGDTRHLVVGSGSNLLFTGDFDGWVLHNEIKGIEIVDETEEEVLIKAGGGESWSEFVDFTVEQGWWGLENLSLIPGTTGAAPVQNIGAYGTEQQEAFVSLEAMNLATGRLCTFNKLECDFGYRQSIFKEGEKGKWMVLNVTYRLKKKALPNLNYAPLQKFFEERKQHSVTVKEVSLAVKSIRRSKLPDPETVGNAGSFFKNPVVMQETLKRLQQRFPGIPFYPVENGTVKIPAGWLIEQAGWKGKRLGRAGVHKQQALVIVNYGGATGKEILALAEKVQNDVQHKFRITLEPEVQIL